MKPSRTTTILVMGLLILIWGTTWAAIRIGLRGVPPFTGVSLRFLIAAAILFVFGLIRRVKIGGAPHERAIWLVNGVLSFTISYLVVYWCEQWVPSGLSAVLWATFPLFVAILAHFFLKGERLRRAGILGTLIGFLGVAVIFSEDLNELGGPGVARASAVLLLSPLVSAFSNIAVKRWGRLVHPVSMTSVPMAMAGAITGLLALAFERGRPIIWNGPSIGALAYLAVAGSAVTFGLYYWLLSHHKATTLSMIAYCTPVVAVIFGTLVMHEPMTLRMVLGSLLVIAGVATAVAWPAATAPAAPPADR